GAAEPDRRLELMEEKATVYRSLKELAFDHEAGHLSDDDYQELRDRYEARAALLISQLDALGPAAPTTPAEPAATMATGPWTPRPAPPGRGTPAEQPPWLGLGVACR